MKKFHTSKEIPFTKSFKTGQIFAMEGSRGILVDGVLFQSEAYHGKNSSSFKTSFKQWVIGLSFEVYNIFLPQLA